MISIQHVKRDANSAAHDFAKDALLLPNDLIDTEDIPECYSFYYFRRDDVISYWSNNTTILSFPGWIGINLYG